MFTITAGYERSDKQTAYNLPSLKQQADTVRNKLLKIVVVYSSRRATYLPRAQFKIKPELKVTSFVMWPET